MSNNNNILVKRTNDLTQELIKNPNKVVTRLKDLMVALATNMVKIQKQDKKNILPESLSLTQRGGANDELVASDGFGVNQVKSENVSRVTEALERALEQAISVGEFEKITHLQDALEREQKRVTIATATKAAKEASAAATRTANAAAQALEETTKKTFRDEMKQNIINGARYAGLAGASYILTRLEYAAPRIMLTLGDRIASSSVAVIVETYNAAFTNVFVSSLTGASPINSADFYGNLITTITESHLGTVIGEESNNLFLVVMLINFALLICCVIMITKLSQVSDVRILGSGISFQRGTTINQREDVVRILEAAQRAAGAIAPPPAAQALDSSEKTPAIEEPPSQYSVEEPAGGGKNKRKRRKSRKQQKSKKSKKSHKSHKSKKQQKSRKQQRKSRKNLKFKKTRK